MAKIINCPKCKKQLKITVEITNVITNLRCPDCGHVFYLPTNNVYTKDKKK